MIELIKKIYIWYFKNIKKYDYFTITENGIITSYTFFKK